MKCNRIAACVLAGLLAAGFATGCKSNDSGQREEREVAITPNIPAESPFAKIKIEMSQGDVINILGQATETQTHVTGKAFNPFNFSGGGAQQLVLYYKGQGRIILENDNAFSNVERVVKVEYDPTEPGFAK